MLSTGEIDEEADQEDFASQDDAYGQKEPSRQKYSTPNKTKCNPKSSSGTLSPRTNELYNSSLNRVNHFQQNKQPTHQMARANKSSRQLASNRQSRLIDNIIGNCKTMKRARLILILKKFNITYVEDVDDEHEGPRPVFWKICDICRIPNQNQNEEEEEEEVEELYDAEKLKELLKKAASGGKVTGVAAQIKPSVMSAISNMPIDIFTLRSRNVNDNNSGRNSSPSTPTRSQKRKKKNSPKLTINVSPNRNSLYSPTKSDQTQNKKKNNDNDYDEEDNDLKNKQQKPIQKKRVTGSKYLPSFYDNLDMNRSPM